MQIIQPQIPVRFPLNPHALDKTMSIESTPEIHNIHNKSVFNPVKVIPTLSIAWAAEEALSLSMTYDYVFSGDTIHLISTWQYKEWIGTHIRSCYIRCGNLRILR